MIIVPRQDDPRHAYQTELYDHWHEWNSEAQAALSLYRHARALQHVDAQREEHAVHRSRLALMDAMADLRSAEGDDWEYRRDMVEAKRQAFEASVATLRRRSAPQ